MCRIVARLQNAAGKEACPSGKPGYILFAQTFGDPVTFHPHIHALVADGVFSESGTFCVLPAIPSQLLIRHIPDRGEHLVRYYGWYSSRCRGERRRMLEASEAEAEQQATIALDEQLDPVLINALRSTRARLIKKVHEVNPLICPHCGEEMRFLAFIEEQPVIEKILRHIKAWSPWPPLRAPPDDDWPENSRIPLSYHPVPDIA